MAKKKGLRAQQAKARRAARDASPEPPSPRTGAAGGGPAGPAVPADGRRVRRGLMNLKNTCFMNSILQCLNVSMPFSDELISLALEEGLHEVAGSLSSAFRGIRGLEGGQKEEKAGFSPKPLLTKLVSRFEWYGGGQQHDAHELLRTLLGCISDEVTAEEEAARSAANGAPRSGAPGPASHCERCIWDNFRGHLCAAVLCWDCGHISMKMDPFLDVSLELPPLKTTLPRGPLGMPGRSDDGTGASSNGAAPPPPSEEDAEAAGGSESDDGCPRSKKKQEKKERKKNARAEAASASAPTPAPGVPKPRQTGAGPRPPMGAWARGPAPGIGREARAELAAKAAVEEAVDKALKVLEARNAARVLLSDLFNRIAERLVGEEEETQEAAEEISGPVVEIELMRTSRKSVPQWGFKWSEAQLQEDTMLLAGIAEGSILEKWNLKCRALGDEDSVVCVGDRLIEVNGETSRKEMQTSLRSADKVDLRFARGGPGAAAGSSSGKRRKPSDGKEESDEEAATRAAEKEERWRTFAGKAEACYSSLPEQLREVFGPEKRRETNGHVNLEDCLHHFSTVEALEQDFAPSYSCSSCQKSQSSGTGCRRTYASKRLWLCSAELPPLLTLQLKRFRQYFGRYEKSTMSIRLPVKLDLSSFVLGQESMERLRPHLAPDCNVSDAMLTSDGVRGAPRYELYGICVHIGSSMKGGHYVAYVNSGVSLEREEWFRISDAKVCSCDRAEVLKQEAYVAFYRREDCVSALAAVAAAETEGAAEPEKKAGPATAAARSEAAEEQPREDAEATGAEAEGEADVDASAEASSDAPVGKRGSRQQPCATAKGKR